MRVVSLLLATCVVIPVATPQGVIYVDCSASGASTGESWHAAFTDLRAALAIATSGDEVWVAQGEYKPDARSGDIELSFAIPAGVSIIGGFLGGETSSLAADPEAFPVILTGDLLDNDDGSISSMADNTRTVVRVVAGIGMTQIKGVVISGGQGILTEPVQGGGIHINEGTLSLLSCIVRDNLSVNGGGAIVSGTAHVVMTDTEFTGNRAYGNGGGLLLSGGAVVETYGCTFATNESMFGAGGACHAGESSTAILRDTQFVGNRAYLSGGVHCNGVGAVSVHYCRFIGNQSSTGGAAYIKVPGLTEIADCEFIGNRSSSQGAAAIAAFSHLAISRCTIAANTYAGSALGGGGAINAWAVVYLRDSIVWGNSSPALPGNPPFTFGFGGAVQSCYSDVQSLGSSYCGDTSFSVDPRFVDLDGPDDVLGTIDDSARLASDSPCIDRGDPTIALSGLDLGGMLRVLDGDLDGSAVVDMGAQEFTNVRLVDKSTTESRTTHVSVELEGAPGLLGFLLVSLHRGVTPSFPLGTLYFDASKPWARVAVGVMPASLEASLFQPLPFSVPLVIQGLGIDPGSGFGNLSNAIKLDPSLP